MTTNAIQDALDAAYEAATNVSRTDAGAMTSVTNALNNALEAAKNADITVLYSTAALAQREGVTLHMEEVMDYCQNGTTNRIDELLRKLRNARKLNAIEKVDITKIECSEPTNAEADYYLYNVGAGVFFSTTSDWGTHIALDNPGMLIHFRPDGEWSGADVVTVSEVGYATYVAPFNTTVPETVEAYAAQNNGEYAALEHSRYAWFITL